MTVRRALLPLTATLRLLNEDLRRFGYSCDFALFSRSSNSYLFNAGRL